MLTPEGVKNPDPRIDAVLAAMQDWEFDVAQDVEFADQDVYLDGREFVNCSFRNCRIFITMGYFRMLNPRAFVDCNFLLAGPADIMKSLIDVVEGRQAR